MTMRRKTAILVIAALIVMIISACLYVDRLVVFYIASSYKLDVRYAHMRAKTSGEFIFEDLRIVDKKTGRGLYAKHASMRPDWKTFPRSISPIEMTLSDVRFNKMQQAAASYGSLNDLILVPFDSEWKYRQIYGKLGFDRGTVSLADLSATGEDMRLLLNGMLDHNAHTIKADVTIYFSAAISKRIPDELSKVLLVDQQYGWKSLSVSLSGNYENPALQVSGKFFRLNIKEISGT